MFYRRRRNKNTIRSQLGRGSSRMLQAREWQANVHRPSQSGHGGVPLVVITLLLGMLLLFVYHLLNALYQRLGQGQCRSLLCDESFGQAITTNGGPVHRIVVY
jgi:hypothetical protein